MRRLADRLGLDPRAALGLLVLGGGLLLWGFAFVGGGFRLFGGSTTKVKADFGSVQYIVKNDPVRINGVMVGRVSDSKADPGGRGGTLTLELDKDAGKIYKDASASILWRTALGANEAVALDPGTPSKGELGGATIPQSQTSNQVELDEVTQTFRDGAQPGMQTMLKETGPALENPRDLGRALTVLGHIAPSAGVGVGALRGQVRDTDLRELVQNAGDAAQALDVGSAASDTQRFVESAATTLQAIDRGDLGKDLFWLSDVTKPSSVLFAHLDRELDQIDPLLPKLDKVLPQAAPTLRALNPTATHLQALLRDADPLLHDLRPTVHSLQRTADVGVPVVNAISPSFRRLANGFLPAIQKTYPEQSQPVYKLIGPTFIGLGVLANFMNQNGGFANLTAGMSVISTPGIQILPCSTDFSGTNFLVCSSLADSLQLLFGGSPSQLRELAARPGGAQIFGPLIKNAEAVQSRLQDTRERLAKIAPAVAKQLFASQGNG
jgi:phospholipid/cholesterol/gamma-HCH transport system substrate-binding protein